AAGARAHCAGGPRAGRPRHGAGRQRGEGTLAREAAGIGRRRRRGAVARRRAAARELVAATGRGHSGVDRVRRGRTPRGAPGGVTRPHGRFGLWRQRLPLLRQHTRRPRTAPVWVRLPPRERRHRGVWPGGRQRHRFRRSRRRALRRGGEPALLRIDGARRAGAGDFDLRAARPGAFAVPLPGSTLAEDCVTAATRTVEHVTCLGCGCACDDITVVVQRGRLTEAQRACALGAAWFGDGQVPDAVRIRGRAGTLERALAEATALLTDAKRPLVYLAGDISCEVQRDAVAIADRLKGAIDSLASTAAPG